MVNQNIDFFQTVDNFAKTATIPSIPIIESKLDFIPKVTIAIPTYKRTELLKIALDSALNQINYKDFEVIVIDNNPDRDCDTELMIKAYSDIRFSYFKNSENIGMFGNWNRCIELSRGEYLTILNDDDLLQENYLFEISRTMQRLKNAKAIFVKNIQILNSSNHISNDNKDINKAKNSELIRKLFPLSLIQGNINPGSLGVFVNKDALMKSGGYNDAFYPVSDYVFWVNFISNYPDSYLIDKYLAFYRLFINESLKTEVQVVNIRLDKIIRQQLLLKYKNVHFWAKYSLAMYDYLHFLRVCDYSEEFKRLYSQELYSLKKKNGICSIISYKVMQIYLIALKLKGIIII